MAIVHHDKRILQKDLILGLKEWLTPLWNWTKVESSEKLTYSVTNSPWVEFYVGEKTALKFELNNQTGTGTYAYPNWFVMTYTDVGEIRSYFDNNTTSYHTSDGSDYYTRIRFTTVGENGFLLGVDSFESNSRCGDFTLPIVMGCKIGNKSALLITGIRARDTEDRLSDNQTFAMYSDGIAKKDLTTVTRRISSDAAQLIPVCTVSGECSDKAFIPIMTNNDTLRCVHYTINGKNYYGNALFALAED